MNILYYKGLLNDSQSVVLLDGDNFENVSGGSLTLIAFGAAAVALGLVAGVVWEFVHGAWRRAITGFSYLSLRMFDSFAR